VIAVSIVDIPAAVLAQAAISRTTLDEAGAAVAGVTVEASGPELL
jgi:hypothetical protein